MSNCKKKYIAFSFILSIIFGPITVQSASAEIAIGGYAGYTFDKWGVKGPLSVFGINENGDANGAYSNHSLGFGAFFDIKYLRIALGYSTVIGDTKLKADLNYDDYGITVSDSSNKKFDMSFLNLSLLAKYPFELGIVKLWPAAGIGYDLNLTAKDDGEDIKSDSALSDFFILAGLGADIRVTEKVFISPSLIYGYNLTPNMDKEKTSGVSWYGWKICANIAVGYTF